MTRAQIADRQLVAYANAYAQYLGRVFPIPVPHNPKTKKEAKALDPKLSWGKNASADPDTLRQWFGAAALIDLKGGVATPPNILCTPCPGLLALDVDLPDGPKSLKAFEAEHGPLPPTLTARTPSGGVHLWFRIDGALKVGSPTGGETGPYAGLDIRSSGEPSADWAGAGCLVMAPSIRPASPGTDELPGNEAGTYEWTNWEPLSGEAPKIAGAPQWVIDYAIKGVGKRKGAKRCGSAGNFEDWERQIDEAGKDWRAQKAVIASLALDGGLDAGDHDDLLDHAKRVSGKRIGRLRQTLKDAQREHAPQDGRPVIDLIPGQLHDTVEAAVDVLAQVPNVRVWAGALVELAGDKPVDIERPRLAVVLSRKATIVKGDKVIDWPRDVLESVLTGPTWGAVKVVKAFCRQPCVASNVMAPGYANGVEAIFDADEYKPVLDVPSLWEVMRYREGWESDPLARAPRMLAYVIGELRTLLSGWKFQTPVDESCAMALLLSAVLRPGLPTAPAFLIRADQPDVGKSILMFLAAVLASAEDVGPLTWKRGKEQDDVLESALLKAPPIIMYDDVDRGCVIHSHLLAKVLTSELVGVRRKGHSEVREVGTRALIMFTGNAISVKADMTRRFLTINLAPREGPLPAGAPRDPVTWARQNRARLVMLINAALADLLQYQFDGGRMAAVSQWRFTDASMSTAHSFEDVATLHSYEGWSNTVMRALFVAGLPSPTDSIAAQREDDPESAALAAFGRACAVYFEFEALALTPMWERVESARMDRATSLAAAADDELTFVDMWRSGGEHSLFNPGMHVKEARQYAVKEALLELAQLSGKSQFDAGAVGNLLRRRSIFGDFRLVEEATPKTKHKGSKRYAFEPLDGSAKAPQGAPVAHPLAGGRCARH